MAIILPQIELSNKSITLRTKYGTKCSPKRASNMARTANLYLVIKAKGFLVGPSEIAPELEKNYTTATSKLHTVSPKKNVGLYLR
jgi:hypothetical protein